MREFEKQGISMPDDAREIIFPQGIVVHQQGAVDANSGAKTKTIPPAPSNDTAVDLTDIEQQEDLSSDSDDIRQQAKEARDPEKGQNIL